MLYIFTRHNYRELFRHFSCAPFSAYSGSINQTKAIYAMLQQCVYGIASCAGNGRNYDPFFAQ